MDKSSLQNDLQQVQTRLKSLLPKANLDKKDQELKTLQAKIEAPGFWDNPQAAQAVSQKAAFLEKTITDWQQLQSQLSDLDELLFLAHGEDVTDLSQELALLKDTLEKLETATLLSGQYDDHGTILTLNVGNGGQDAEDFCQMLQRMYLRYADHTDFNVEMLEESTSEFGLKSATFSVKGPFAYGFLRGEHGVHRLIRQSPFNAKGLRQTSFARVEVLPLIKDDQELKIDPSDLRIDVFRSSGAGGQSVNTTDSAVRITYLPLNLIVTCQNEKSQHQNKAAAMEVLRSRLAQLMTQQKAEKLAELKGELANNSFGSQIRTYTLHPYKLVKDHRTNLEISQVDKVLDGELEDLINSFLRA